MIFGDKMGYFLLPKYAVTHNYYLKHIERSSGSFLDLCNVYFGDLELFRHSFCWLFQSKNYFNQYRYVTDKLAKFFFN